MVDFDLSFPSFFLFLWEELFLAENGIENQFMNKATCCLIYQTNHLDELNFDEQTKVMHTITSYNLNLPLTLLFYPTIIVCDLKFLMIILWKYCEFTISQTIIWFFL